MKLQAERLNVAKTPAWHRKEGQNPRGGLNARGTASYKKETGGTLRRLVKSGDNSRRGSFLARMGASKGQTTIAKIGPRGSFFHCVPGVHFHQVMQEKKEHQF